MKNTQHLIAVTSIFLLFVLGCSSLSPFGDKAKSNQTSNKSLADKAVDTAVGDEKIGVPECDEVMDMLAAETDNPDDNIVTKAIKATFLNKVKQSIKESVEKNKNDKAQLAKSCKEFKAQLEKYKADEAQKKGK